MNVSLTDDGYFDFVTKSLGYTQKNLAKFRKGNIPVFTAAQEAIGYIEEIGEKPPIFASEESPILSFANDGDGSAGRNFILHCEPFYINASRIGFTVKRDDINIRYVYATIRDMKERYGFSYTHKATKNNLSKVLVPLPIQEDGTINITYQDYYLEAFEQLKQMKSEVIKRRKEILDITIAIDVSGYKFSYRKVSDLFSILRGSGIYTKDYTKNHVGQIPLYSGNTSGAFAYVDTEDYDVPCLSWVIDGLAGYMMVHTSAFSATNHRGILLSKTDKIDLDYVKFVAEPIFRNAKKGRMGENEQNEYTSLPPFMVQNLQIPLPVDDNGNISIVAQKEIAEKYLAVQQCKQEVVSKLDELISQKISI